MLWTFISHVNLRLFLKIFQLVSQPFVVRPIVTGKGFIGVALVSEEEKWMVVDFERDCIVF